MPDRTGPGSSMGAGPYTENDLLPVSLLSHMVFCPRRAGLIMLEGLWAENRHTAEGSDLHQSVHAEGSMAKGSVVEARGLRLRSMALGLSGVTDVVEFHPLEGGAGRGCALAGRDGLFQPVPIEYKRGRPQPDDCYHVQLCAQALCLEEMTGADVPLGYLFHAAPRRRQEVELGRALRERTRSLAVGLHGLFASGRTPGSKFQKKCRGCSMIDICQPRIVARSKSARRYVSAALGDLGREEAQK